MKPFKILSTEKILDVLYCPVEKHRVELPNGKEADWFVTTFPDAVIVVPFLPSGEVILEKTYKHGCRNIVIEFCAGIIDPGEEPLHAAHRELQEETGFTTKSMKKIGEVFANPTGSTMKYHYFVALDCQKTGPQKLDDAEQIEVFTLPDFAAAQELLLHPDTKTASTIIAALGFTKAFLENK